MPAPKQPPKQPSKQAQVTVRLSGALRHLAGDLRQVSLRGSTVRDVLAALVERHPELRPRLREESWGIRSSVLVFLNSEDIRSREGEKTPVAEGDELDILPVADGG